MQINTEVSNKIANLSVLGALMVVLIHIPKCHTAAVSVMYDILPDGLLGSAVMMFFAISGYLIAGHVQESGWWKREAVKRMRSLLIPYLILNLSWYGVLLCYHAVGMNSVAGAPFLAGLIHAIGGARGGPIIGPLWYVRCLLVIVLLLPVFTWIICRGRLAAWGLCLLLFAGRILTVHGGGFFLEEVFQLHGVAFFMAGMTLRLYGLPCVPRGLGVGLLLVSFVLSAAMVAWEDTHLFGKIAYWLLKPVMVVSLWSLMPSTPLPRILVRNTFPVYALHYIIIQPSWLIAEKFGVWNLVFGSFITYFVFPLLIFLLIIVFAECLRKWLPLGAALILGGR